ncbi:Extracellular endo-alpha-(1-_5)-L-arabinanase 2 [Cytospora mali]|uniref:Extracellular endo-alpha-(1->5)-L-arabinanase 2 n=1 Tax=Cytospora mali TaxID=578113 RepID=A0A194UYR5_CYTMA|nr:Extracellular endo-alpha-(1->5)-L-arabinanase 2 [Valsa mali var. pyri (nom. inval.)]
MKLLSPTPLSASLLSLLLIQSGQAAPKVGQFHALNETSIPITAAINRDFPDPAILEGEDGWYAFATASGDKQVQVAKAPTSGGPWSYLDVDLLPNPGAWTTRQNTWAPDVRMVDDGTYVMYYSGELADDPAHHCLGVATADNITGPWTADDDPWICDIARGGSIDPSGFLDEQTGRRYVVYKVDGNSIGKGGDCNNGIEPKQPTPIMLQEVAKDGTTLIGTAVELLDRTDADGPLVEAPNLIKAADGSYVLFFSSHCFTSAYYDVKYATSESITGPYARKSNPLFRTGYYSLASPGGATSAEEGDVMVFHGNCPAGRCMYMAKFAVTHEYVLTN